MATLDTCQPVEGLKASGIDHEQGAAIGRVVQARQGESAIKADPSKPELRLSCGGFWELPAQVSRSTSSFPRFSSPSRTSLRRGVWRWCERPQHSRGNRLARTWDECPVLGSRGRTVTAHLGRVLPFWSAGVADHAAFASVDSHPSPSLPCAVQRRHSSAGANPARQLSLQPVAVGAGEGGNDIV